MGESVQGLGVVADTDFLSEDAAANDGAVPSMNVCEADCITGAGVAYTWGSSSHITLFRNHVRCKNTTSALDASPWLWVCVEIEQYNRYYNLVGNVLGLNSFTGGTVVDDGSRTGLPIIYRFGYSSA